MKKIGLYVLVLLISLPAFAQKTEDFFGQLTNKYGDKDGFSASMITKDMFDLYLRKKNVDSESSVSEAIKSLDKIMIVSQSNMSFGYVTSLGNTGENTKKDKEEPDNELLETILNHYKTGGYTLLKTEKRMGEEVKVYLKKNQDKVESLALISSSSASTNLIELQGDINLAAVADLSKAFNLRGLENLNKINGSGGSFYVGTSTGYVLSQEKLQEMAEKQRELADRQQKFTDEQRAKFQEQSRLALEKQLELAEKSRELAEQYHRQPIFLSYPGDSTIYYVDGKKVDADQIKELLDKGVKSIVIDKPTKDDKKTIVRIKTK